jgi:hypothetical protein
MSTSVRAFADAVVVPAGKLTTFWFWVEGGVGVEILNRPGFPRE